MFYKTADKYTNNLNFSYLHIIVMHKIFNFKITETLKKLYAYLFLDVKSCNEIIIVCLSII